MTNLTRIDSRGQHLDFISSQATYTEFQLPFQLRRLLI